MRLPIRFLTALASTASVVALASGCAQGDPRFAPFTSKTDAEPTIAARTDSFNERMPNLGATEGHYAAATTSSGRGLPSPDQQYWFTGVATVPAETIAVLQPGATGNADKLPGIHPELYQYVPKNCQFATIAADHANSVLDTAKTDFNSDFGSFSVTGLAASADCNLVVVTGEGVFG